ncbi:MAG: methionyl-tRNA formyltransferase, partial [Micrococcales bacterium]
MSESLIFAGTPANAAVTLEHLVRQGFDISLVITRPDAPFGRKRVLTPSPVAVVADKYGLEVLKTKQIDASVIDRISATGSTTAVVVAYGALLRAPALKALSNGWFNLHYSLLPRWRGAAPVQHAILSGDRETGVTLFKIDEGLDTGAVIASVPTQIQHSESAGRLLARLTELGCTLLSQELPRILLEQYTSSPQEVGHDLALAPKLTREDARIDWSTSAMQVERKVLAMNPEPGAWTTYNGNSVKIHSALEVVRGEGGAAGTVKFENGKVLVDTAAGTIELLEVQPAGKKAMPAKEWAKGVSL